MPCTISHDGALGATLHPGCPDEMLVQRVCLAVLLSVPHGVAIGSYLELSVRFESAQPIERIVKRI